MGYETWENDELIEELQDRDADPNAVQMNKWEVGFCASILEQTYPLTDAQRTKLIQIFMAQDERED